MQCNIDAKGKSLRLIGGLIVSTIGLILLVLALLGMQPFWAFMGPAIGCILGGAFQIYEGWCGWCVLRAMGFKTPV